MTEINSNCVQEKKAMFIFLPSSVLQVHMISQIHIFLAIALKFALYDVPLNILKCTLIFFNARYSMYTILLLFSNSTESISNVSHKGAENKLECLHTVAVVRRCSVKKLFLDIS